MNATRIMWINGLLFLVILAIAVVIMTEQRTLPGEPPLEQAKEKVAILIAEDQNNPQSDRDTLAALGTTNIFDTIIPLPTPTVAPTRTPTPPPRLTEVTENWKLSWVLSGRAGFQNYKTEKDFIVELGDHFVESYRGENYKIYLESVNKKSFTATIMMNEQGEVQKRTLAMFE